MVLPHSAYCFFLVYQLPASVFEAISVTRSVTRSSQPYLLTMYVSQGNFTVHHNEWLTYSGRTDKPGKRHYNFSLGFLTVTLTALLF